MLTYLDPRRSHAAVRVSLVCLIVFIGLSFGVALTIPDGAVAHDDRAPVCGDANGDGDVSTSDALGILRFSSGQEQACAPPACDANGSGAVTVTDALMVLGVVVGMDMEVVCPLGIAVGDSDVIDFEDLMAGQVIDSVTSLSGIGPIGVSGANPNANFDETLNAAIVYDSSCAAGCTGGDIDLGTPNQDFDGPGIGDGGRDGSPFANSVALGNIAILAENLRDGDGDDLVDDPDDQGAGPVTLRFEFSALGSVSIREITIIDVELTEMMPLVELFDADGGLIASQSLANTGNNGVNQATIDPNSGVVSMRVSARGSIGIDNVVFAVDVIVTTSSTTSTTMGVTTTTSSTTSTTMGVTTTTSSTTSTTMGATTTTSSTTSTTMGATTTTSSTTSTTEGATTTTSSTTSTTEGATTTTSSTTSTTIGATTTTSSTTSTEAPTTTTMPVTTTTIPVSPVVNFRSVIDCEQATTCSVPPCTGSGAGTFSLNTDTMLMSYDVSFMNLSATETVSHIHGPAEPGAQAGVQVDLPLGTPKVGEVTITEQQQADMLAGLFYLNIHSGNCPGGEIRGQILIDDATTTTMPATTTTMAPTTTLPPMGECGDGTVDPGEDCDPGASGSGECCTDSCTFVGAGTACGEPGNACTDADSCDGAGTCVPGDFKPAETPCFSPEDTDCTNPDSCNGMGICLARNEPDGTQCTTDPCGDAATCQGGLCTCPATTTLPPTTTTTLPQTMFSFSTVMDCEQATTCGVPPCTGAGSGSFTLDTVSGAMGYDVSFMNLSADETVSHIHGPAESGVQAGVAVDLPNGTPKIGAVVLSAQQQEEMLAGLYYVNVHSGNCPGGEIRGQILLNEAVPTGSASFEVLRNGALFY